MRPMSSATPRDADAPPGDTTATASTSRTKGRRAIYGMTAVSDTVIEKASPAPTLPWHGMSSANPRLCASLADHNAELDGSSACVRVLLLLAIGVDPKPSMLQ